MIEGAWSHLAICSFCARCVVKYTLVWDNRLSYTIYFLENTPPRHAIRRKLRQKKRNVDFPLEQRELLGVLDAVSLQCSWLIVEEAICPQCRNRVHDKVAYRPVAWMYNLCRILQHIVDGFDEVSLIPNWSIFFHIRLANLWFWIKKFFSLE